LRKPADINELVRLLAEVVPGHPKPAIMAG
jgi:hypothetical protein